MKKLVIASIVSVLSFGAVAADQYKSGFALQGGYSKMDSAANALNVDVSYTTSGGFIYGLSSTPMVDVYDGYEDFKIGNASFYLGYEMDSGLRLTGGVGVMASEFKSYYGDTYSDAETGLALGLGYVFKNGFMFGSQIQNVADGTIVNLNLGYKF